MSASYTFADARRLVRDHLLDQWTAANGRLRVAEYGYESPTHWRVIAGSAAVADEDEDEVADDFVPDRSYLVSKESGTVEAVADTDERLPSMTPYGQIPPD